MKAPNSKGHMKYTQQALEFMLKEGDLVEVLRKVKVSLDVKGQHICNYVVDFVVTHKDGLMEFINIARNNSSAADLKLRLFEALYADVPNSKITIK